MLDYPEHLACIVWFAGCNMRCPYCYNPHIVLERGKKSEQELFEFLQKRTGRLEGVVLSGGECTLYKKLIPLCAKIKTLGFKIKLDTNGSNPNVLKRLIEEDLINFVSLDFKAPKTLFKSVTLSVFYDALINSLQILQSSGMSFEVRTTVHTDMLNENAINEIIDILFQNNYNGIYYIQDYLHVKPTLGETQPPTKVLDKSLLSNKIKIAFRN
jgi:pyruvate formate lyase activating enzyme